MSVRFHANTLSPKLTKTSMGKPYLKPDKRAEGLPSIWQNKMPEDKKFAERSIGNWIKDQDYLQTDSEGFCYAPTSTISNLTLAPLPHNVFGDLHATEC